MAEDARLQIVLRLKDEASKRMKNVDKSFKASAARIGKSAAVGTAVVGTGFVAAGTQMQSFGDGIKEAENAIRMGTGAMGDDLDAMMDSTGNVSGQVPQDFKTVATAIADVNTEFGMVGKPLEDTTQMFLDVARVAGTEAGPMIKGVSDIMEMFGVDQAEANRVLGDFITTAQNTGQPLEKVISDMVTYGPVLKNAGMETDTAAAFLGAFAKVGVDASRVMPGVKKRVDDLAKAGLPDLNQALMDDIVSLSNMEDQAHQSKAALDLFGGEGAARIVAAINAGLIPATDELIEKLGLTEDEVANLTTGTMTTSEQFKVLKNKFSAVLAPFSEYIALIGAILIPIGLLALAVGGLTLAAGALGLSLWPVLAVIAAVVAAVTLGVIIFKNWDNIVGFLGDTWDKVWGKMEAPVMAVWGVIKTVVNGYIDLINLMIRGANKVKLPKWIPGIGGKGIDIPEIPSLAKGGIVRKPTIAQIGEAGPEAVVPLKAGVGMGTNITINFPQGSTVILDNEESARSLADQITQQIRGVMRAQGAF